MTRDGVRDDLRRLRRAAIGTISGVAALWLIHAARRVSDGATSSLGIEPRSVDGLLGILTAPLLHGSVSHLLGNTLPLLVLGTAVAFEFRRYWPALTVTIWLGSGAGVWLLAREAVHLGASGVAYGLMAFVLVAGLRRRDQRSIALVLLVLFLHGGMVWGLLPLESGVSFESHLAGAIVGGLCALRVEKTTLRQRRPRKYAWEGKEIDDEHPAADLFIERDNDERR
jgi:membrane associated rhomboid family serine protease